MPYSPWPPGFQRIPDEDWTSAPVDSLALKYDRVDRHGWYDNLDPTVAEVGAFMRGRRVLVDYSGGTGILIERLLRAEPDQPWGVVNVDSSPKFLRLSLEKLRDEPRVAFRLIRFLKDEKRLQFLDESLEVREVDAIASCNAVHLYYDLGPTLASWRRVLRDDGRVFVQSGNIQAPGDGWIIDDTVNALHEEARRIVSEDARFAAYRAGLADAKRMAHHDSLRAKFFLPARPRGHYVAALQDAGFDVMGVRTERVHARTQEWLDFLWVYHEGVLGWVGGSERVPGDAAPTQDALRDRRELMQRALERVLGGKESFDATWTYITARPA